MRSSVRKSDYATVEKISVYILFYNLRLMKQKFQNYKQKQNHQKQHLMIVNNNYLKKKKNYLMHKKKSQNLNKVQII